VEQLPPHGCALALNPADPSSFSAVGRLCPTTFGGVPGADVDWVDPFEPDEGDVPTPDDVVVGVVEAVPGPTGDVVGVVPGVDVTVVVVALAFRPDDGRGALFGFCRMPATARFCWAETCGPEHAAAAPASAKTASGTTAPLPVRCGVGLSFPGSRAGQGRAHTTQRQQRKNLREKGPGCVR
jgi:hypothetical protein